MMDSVRSPLFFMFAQFFKYFLLYFVPFQNFGKRNEKKSNARRAFFVNFPCHILKFML